MQKTYFIYYPLTEGSIEEEWKQCREQIENTQKSGYTPVKLNIFTDLPDFETFLSKLGTIREDKIKFYI